MKITTTRRQLIRSLWWRGLLEYKLKPHQPILYAAMWKAIKNRTSLKHFVNCSRRFGKTHILCLIAVEFAIRNPGSMIRFAAPTMKSLIKSIFPIMNIILKDCPNDLKPILKAGEGMFQFNNGSQIHMSGTDNGHHESLRGTKSDLNLIDEAGFMDNLEYIVKSILIPQTLTCNGFTLISSTPPKVADHDCYYLFKECSESGDLSEFTIYDNTSIDAETFEKYAKEAGGVESTTFKREYLGQYVTDTEQMVLPEWDDEFIQEFERSEYFEYYHKYVALDIGVRDFTAGLFAYYDYANARIVIEDEYTINGPEMTTDMLATDLRAIEKRLWREEPHLRIADNNNLILCQDLSILHNLPFVPTNKSTLEAMVNQVRIMLREKRLYIHPRCVMTIGCMKYGVWGKASENGRAGFAKSKVYGHYDHLAALVYLVRNIDTNFNPIPRQYGTDKNTMWVNDTMLQNNQNNEQWGSLAGIRR